MNRTLEDVESLQNLLIACCTGEAADDGDYVPIRARLLRDPEIADKLPRFVRTCRALGQFRTTMQEKFGRYHERRAYIWGEFQPLLDELQLSTDSPVQAAVSGMLTQLDTSQVHATWKNALDRRHSDPEGAITLARTLLESVCKLILDANGVEYKRGIELPKLYGETARQLSLSPAQHNEELFRRILGGCHAVVEGLGSLRNDFGDAHGRGIRAVKPAPRHAELAVNLAGAMAAFLVSTFEAKQNGAIGG